MSLGPALRSPFTDITGNLLTSQTFGECADFEMRFIDCLEAYGAVRARAKCMDVYEDFRECALKKKQAARMYAMRLERHRQWLKGERKEHYAEAPPVDSY